MSAQENLAVVQQMFACFGRADVAGVLQLLADDVSWFVPGPSVIPYAGMRRGHAEVVEFFRHLGSSAKILTFVPEEFLTSGDKVIVLGHERFRALPTGREVENAWAFVFTVRGGRIVAFRAYEDTAALAAGFSTK